MGDNERLWSMEHRLRLKRSTAQAGLESGTARSALHALSYHGSKKEREIAILRPLQQYFSLIRKMCLRQ